MSVGHWLGMGLAAAMLAAPAVAAEDPARGVEPPKKGLQAVSSLAQDRLLVVLWASAANAQPTLMTLHKQNSDKSWGDDDAKAALPAGALRPVAIYAGGIGDRKPVVVLEEATSGLDAAQRLWRQDGSTLAPTGPAAVFAVEPSGDTVLRISAVDRRWSRFGTGGSDEETHVETHYAAQAGQLVEICRERLAREPHGPLPSYAAGDRPERVAAELAQWILDEIQRGNIDAAWPKFAEESAKLRTGAPASAGAGSLLAPEEALLAKNLPALRATQRGCPLNEISLAAGK